MQIIMSDSDKFSVETRDGYGRVLVAARDISAWQLVIEDSCLVTTPNDVPVCLGCLAGLSDHSSSECGGCGWPMCSRECHHGEEECRLFSENGVSPRFENFHDKHWLYTAVAILRMLLLKKVVLLLNL